MDKLIAVVEMIALLNDKLEHEARQAVVRREISSDTAYAVMRLIRQGKTDEALAQLAPKPPMPVTTPASTMCWFDGGCHGNGTANPKAYGSYKVGVTGKPYYVEFPDLHTNNQAEYAAFTALIKHIIDRGAYAQVIEVKTDSQLVVNQMAGTWKVSDIHLRVMKARVLEMITNNKLDVRLTWVRREEIVPVLGH